VAQQSTPGSQTALQGKEGTRAQKEGNKGEGAHWGHTKNSPLRMEARSKQTGKNPAKYKRSEIGKRSGAKSHYLNQEHSKTHPIERKVPIDLNPSFPKLSKGAIRTGRNKAQPGSYRPPIPKTGPTTVVKRKVRRRGQQKKKNHREKRRKAL